MPTSEVLGFIRTFKNSKSTKDFVTRFLICRRFFVQHFGPRPKYGISWSTGATIRTTMVAVIGRN